MSGDYPLAIECGSNMVRVYLVEINYFFSVASYKKITFHSLNCTKPKHTIFISLF
jgi:hypothetical protein